MCILPVPLCVFPIEQGIRDAFRGFHSGSVDEVGVSVAGRGDLRVSELLGHRHDVCAVGDQYAGDRMPEGVRIDRRQVVAIGELARPRGDARRVHRFAELLCEDVPHILPAVAAFDALRVHIFSPGSSGNLYSAEGKPISTISFFEYPLGIAIPPMGKIIEPNRFDPARCWEAVTASPFKRYQGF